MIMVYSADNTEFTRNGNAVLNPVECTITEDAGGSFELEMRHPIQTDGKWSLLQTGAIIRAPIPTRTIANAFSGVDADIYVTNTSAALRDSPSEGETISYSSWVSGTIYSIGAKVSYNGKNYQLKSALSTIDANMPPSRNPKWTKIASSTSGGGVLITLSSGTEVLYVRNAGNGWYYVKTWTGIEGYIKASQLTFSRHQEAEELDNRTVTEQLFRIYKTQITNQGQEVAVNARHVSYDLAGTIMSTCNIVKASPALAITLMINAYMQTYQGTIATNLTVADNGKYTGDVTGKSGIYGLLDPDKGMVHYFASQLHRDNWDIFVMANNIKNRGIRMVYGKNLRGVTWMRDSGSLVTRVVPVAKDEEGNDLYLPEKWIDSEYINDYPVIMMEQLRVNGQVGRDDGTETATNWTLASLYTEMRTKAGERFSVDHADGIKTEITIDFAQLGDSAEYAYLKDLERIEMYDQITVIHEDLGLEQQLQVSQIVWDAILKRYNSIKVGDVFDYGGRTTTGYSVGEDALYYEKINGATVSRIRREAVEDARPEINQAEESAVTTAYNRVLDYLREEGVID